MSAQTAAPTGEKRIAALFGLSGDSWMRHANPWSVWTRFAVVPLLALSIWTYDRIGWWSLVPVALSLVFMMINPLLFPAPRSTRNWASKAVFGERIWADRDTVDIPARHRTPARFNVTYAFQTVGLLAMTYGLVRLDVVAVVTGVLLTQVAKLWYLDRMVLIFDEMKERDPARYTGWEF